MSSEKDSMKMIKVVRSLGNALNPLSLRNISVPNLVQNLKKSRKRRKEKSQEIMESNMKWLI